MGNNMTHKKVGATFSIFLAIGAIGAAQATLAPAPLNCVDQFDSVDRLTAHRMPTPHGECLLAVSPDTSGLNYRSFSFSNSGLFQVFNSFNPQGSQPISGARTYFIFPRTGVPDFRFSEINHRLIVTLSDQSTLTFSTETTRALDWDHAFVEAPSVNRQNQGGFEINSAKTLILDTGWAFRKPAYTIELGQSDFKDHLGTHCKLPNRDLFIYDGSSASDPKFRFATDTDLRKFLTERCPLLSF